MTSKVAFSISYSVKFQFIREIVITLYKIIFGITPVRIDESLYVHLNIRQITGNTNTMPLALFITGSYGHEVCLWECIEESCVVRISRCWEGIHELN